jgi:tetratricopeptide (TPR) repeat protein
LALEQKHFSDAEPLLRQTLSVREGSLGPMHTEVAKNLDRLGVFYTDQKRYEEAARVYERSLFIWMKGLGSEALELTDHYQKLAEVYAVLDRTTDAEPLVKLVLTTRESETVTSLNTLASIYSARDNFFEAEPLYRLSLAILDKRGVLTARRPISGGNENLDLLADTAIDYAELLKKMKRKAEATRLEVRVRALMGKNYVAKKRQT